MRWCENCLNLRFVTIALIYLGMFSQDAVILLIRSKEHKAVVRFFENMSQTIVHGQEDD